MANAHERFEKNIFAAKWSSLFLLFSAKRDVFSRRFSIKGKMNDYSSDCFFSSDYNPHTDWSTF